MSTMLEGKARTLTFVQAEIGKDAADHIAATADSATSCRTCSHQKKQQTRNPPAADEPRRLPGRHLRRTKAHHRWHPRRSDPVSLPRPLAHLHWTHHSSQDLVGTLARAEAKTEPTTWPKKLWPTSKRPPASPPRSTRSTPSYGHATSSSPRPTYQLHCRNWSTVASSSGPKSTATPSVQDGWWTMTTTKSSTRSEER